MALIAQDRYRVRPRETPRRFLKSPTDEPVLPTAKVPEKVAVPIPVPVPMPTLKKSIAKTALTKTEAMLRLLFSV